LWCAGGFIGIPGDRTTFYIIKNDVENQGNQEEKEAYYQMKNNRFLIKHYNQSDGSNIPRCLQRGAPAQL